MPYEAFEQNKKLKALDAATAAMGQAGSGLEARGGGVQTKTLERYNHALRFLGRSKNSGAFSVEELAMLEKGTQATVGKLTVPVAATQVIPPSVAHFGRAEQSSPAFAKIA
jgi:hypothetical protein